MDDCLTYYNFLLSEDVYHFRQPIPDKKGNYDLAIRQLFEYMINEMGDDVELWKSNSGWVDGLVCGNWGSFADRKSVV